MGSKTYGNQDQQDGESSITTNFTNATGKPRGTRHAQDNDGDYGNGGDDDDDDDDPTGSNAPELLIENQKTDSGKKKKRKRTKKKKSSAATAENIFPVEQSSPPRILVADLFPNGVFPKGEIIDYARDDNTSRVTGEELRYLSRLQTNDVDFTNNYRKAAEVHRQVRHWVQQTVKPGWTMTEIAEGIDDGVRALLGHQGLEPGDSLKAGLGFPTGLALNHCAAHFTPNAGQKEIVLQQSDVMKVDFGVHINGWIVDSAFTMSFDPAYDNLLAAVRDATNTGVKLAGIDVCMSEIGGAVQEAMESYEVELEGKTKPVKAVRGITGHDIKQYSIHGGKYVPFVKTADQTRMEEGEIFAIETFGSTGRGYIKDGKGVYGYGKVPHAPRVPLHLASARSLLKTIDENFGTLVFCRRYLDRLGLNKYLLGMNSLIANGIVDAYAPLIDVEGSYTAQFEHTIILHPNSKEIVSRGTDY